MWLLENNQIFGCSLTLQWNKDVKAHSITMANTKVYGFTQCQTENKVTTYKKQENPCFSNKTQTQSENEGRIG